MKTDEYTIEIYKTETGKCPYLEWENELEVKVLANVMKRLARVRLGNFGDCKPIQDGIWELRLDTGPGYRIYYGLKKSKIIILLCAGEKKSQKRDISRALKYWGNLQWKQ